MGNVSIDVGLKNIWNSWFAFRRGKTRTKEIDSFAFNLESELWQLHAELECGTYRHGGYRIFTVTDNKRRVISVASLRDRVVHRLIYNYLLHIYNHSFYFDVWSCRPNKGLTGAIKRAQKFVREDPRSFVWRTDITKFFDHVQHDVLLHILRRKISDSKALWLLEEVIGSFAGFTRERESKNVSSQIGIPIGNLTSQIFANIYLNELDRFVMHTIKPKRYLRYGDDFLVFDTEKDTVIEFRKRIIIFLKNTLGLVINPNHDIIVQARNGLHILGVEIFPSGRRLTKRNWTRVKNRLHQRNIGSYSGLLFEHSGEKKIQEFHWRTIELTQTK